MRLNFLFTTNVFLVIILCVYSELVLDKNQKKEEETSFDEGIRLLKENGLIKEQPTGGYVIESTGKSVQLALPEHLREMPLELWNHEDRLWLNTTFIPWPDDKECNMFRTSFNKKKSLRLIGLASFPRSGNTWTRHMMESLTGIFTGSFYYSKMLVFQGFYGEAVPVDSGLVTLIKGHGNFNPGGNQRLNLVDITTPDHITTDEIKKTDNNAILLIRNPYHVIYSYRNYVEKKSSPNWRRHATEDKFIGTDWDKFVRITIQLWEQFYIQWLLEGKDIKMVYYEKLGTNQLESSLKEIASLMNHVIEPDRFKCFFKHLNEFQRKKNCVGHSIQEERKFKNGNIYSRKHNIWINSAIRTVTKEAKKRGFDSSHLLSYTNTNIELNYCSL